MANVVESLVQIGSVVVPYIRSGQGTTVLMLGEGPLDRLAASDRFRQLSDEFRVIAAAPPVECDESWVRDLIDGLGIERPKLVADRRLSEVIARFVAMYADRVAEVVYDEVTYRGGPSESLG